MKASVIIAFKALIIHLFLPEKYFSLISSNAAVRGIHNIIRNISFSTSSIKRLLFVPEVSSI